MRPKKKMMKFGWLGAEIWEFYSRRYFPQDITLVELSLTTTMMHGAFNLTKVAEESKENLQKYIEELGKWKYIFNKF